MEPWNCHGWFFQMQMPPARLHSASNVGRQEANALLYRSRRTVECRWILFTSPGTAMIPTPLTNHACQRIVASRFGPQAASPFRNLSRRLALTAGGRWRGPAALNGARFNWGAASHRHPAADQSSTASPCTLINSRVLAVTSIRPRHKAWPAMRTSNGPIGVPEA